MLEMWFTIDLHLINNCAAFLFLFIVAQVIKLVDYRKKKCSSTFLLNEIVLVKSEQQLQYVFVQSRTNLSPQSNLAHGFACNRKAIQTDYIFQIYIFGSRICLSACFFFFCVFFEKKMSYNVKLINKGSALAVI